MTFTVTPVKEAEPALNRPPPFAVAGGAAAAGAVPPLVTGSPSRCRRAAGRGPRRPHRPRRWRRRRRRPGARGVAAGRLIPGECAGGRGLGRSRGAEDDGAADVVEQAAALAVAGDAGRAARPADGMTARAAGRPPMLVRDAVLRPVAVAAGAADAAGRRRRRRRRRRRWRRSSRSPGWWCSSSSHRRR